MNNLENNMRSIVLQTVEQIVEGNELRVSMYKENPKMLEKGIFYDNDYFRYIMEVDKKRYKKFKDGGFFYHGFAPQDYFSLTKDTTSPTGFKFQFFKIKKGVEPSKALKAIQQGLSFLGCGGVTQIACLTALLSELGTEKFNKIFDHGSETPLTIGEGIRANPILSLDQEIDKNKKILPGQHVFINGPYTLAQEVYNGPVKEIKLYNLKFANGYGGSFNTICKQSGEEPTFIGLGLSSKGLTHKGICNTLIDEYNKTPINDLDLMTEKQYKKMLSTISERRQELYDLRKDDRMTQKEFYENNGGEIVVHDFNYKRIKLLKEVEINEAGELLAKWNSKINK